MPVSVTSFWIYLFFIFYLYFDLMQAADLAKAGVIVHGKVIIAAGTEMAQWWADHPAATYCLWLRHGH